MRTVVSVSCGQYRFIKHGDRLAALLASFGEPLISWREAFPPNSPTHAERPFAFKYWAIEEAINQGYSTILWADSSIIPVRSLLPLWEQIESCGYWFSENTPYGVSGGTCLTCGPWTGDSALKPLGITRTEAFTIPMVIATAFGLDLRHRIAQQFLGEWGYLAQKTTAFCGPVRNDRGEASSDRRVSGHRHDQTAAAVVAHRIGMHLTTPPAWIVDGIPPTDKTILEIQR